MSSSLTQDSTFCLKYLMTLQTKWLLFSPLGLTLIGLGASLMLDAARAKNAGEAWFWYGTLALCVFNAGIAVFGEGVKCAVLLEVLKRDERRETRAA
jgi:hypothetical protein